MERHGAARSTVYRLTDAGGALLVVDGARQPVTLPQRGDSSLPESAEALRAKLRFPVSERSPVG